MTDYEPMSLFYQIVDTSTASWGNYLTGVFAMLAAGYFVAHRLDRTATALVVVVMSVLSYAAAIWFFFRARATGGMGFTKGG